PSLEMVASTRNRVSGLTPGRPLMTLETVMADTPASRATSIIRTTPPSSPDFGPGTITGGRPPEEIGQRLTDLALPETERVREPFRFVGRDALECRGEVSEHGLGQHDVTYVPVNPPAGAPREGLEVGELLLEQVLDRLQDVADLGVGRSPGVDTEACLLLQDRRHSLRVGRRRVDRRQSLEPDVLVRPQRPADVIAALDLQLVLEQAAALLVARGVAGVHRAELTDPERRAGLPHELGPGEESLLHTVAVDVLPSAVPGVGTA